MLWLLGNSAEPVARLSTYCRKGSGFKDWFKALAFFTKLECLTVQVGVKGLKLFGLASRLCGVRVVGVRVVALWLMILQQRLDFGLGFV